MNERVPCQIKLILFNPIFVTNCLPQQGLRFAKQAHACDCSLSKVVFRKRFKLRCEKNVCFVGTKKGQSMGEIV